MAELQNYNDADDPYRAIRVGDAGGVEANKWGLLLTRFMRVMAAFWLLQGLAQWHVVLTAQQPIFDTMPKGAALAVIFFGVLDLVAGVGLWLATPWGGVLWLLIASAQIFVATSTPKFFAGGYWLVAVNLLLIALYFWLTFEAGRDLEAQRVMEQRRRRRSAGRRPPQNPLTAFTRLSLFFGEFLKKKPVSAGAAPAVDLLSRLSEGSAANADACESPTGDKQSRNFGKPEQKPEDLGASALLKRSSFILGLVRKPSELGAAPPRASRDGGDAQQTPEDSSEVVALNRLSRFLKDTKIKQSQGADGALRAKASAPAMAPSGPTQPPQLGAKPSASPPKPAPTSGSAAGARQVATSAPLKPGQRPATAKPPSPGAGPRRSDPV